MIKKNKLKEEEGGGGCSIYTGNELNWENFEMNIWIFTYLALIAVKQAQKLMEKPF